MSINLKHNRWSVTAADFAIRVIVPDLKGFFENLPLIGSAPKGQSLVIEPGTRAIVIDDGLLVGEIGPGEYTLQSLLERLQFWRNKQATIFVTRCEDVPVDSIVHNVPSLDALCFNVSYRWTVQISDVLSFLDNLMGAKESVSVAELESLLAPIMSQAVRDTIGQSSCDEIRAPDFLQRLAGGMHARADAKLKRYGLAFIDIQSAQCTGEDGGIAERRGELWIASRETQLQRAAAGIENEQLSAKADSMRKKVVLRQALRDAVSDDSLKKLENREQFEKAIAEIDKDRLLRQEEREALIAAFEERKADRTQLRGHLLSTMEIYREQELEELRIDMDCAVRTKSLEKEITLSRLAHTKNAEQWQRELERDKEEAMHRRQQKHEALKARWERIREARRQKRDDSWEDQLHQQKLAEVQADLELTRAERQRKVALIQAEFETRLAVEKLEVQKRQQQWELQFQDQKSTSQLDRLQRVQDMNAQFSERQQRMQSELENLKADSANKRELDRIQALSSVGTEVLIATAGSQNAALLADLKKHQATQDAVKAQAAAHPAAQLNDERLRMYEKLNEAERAKADAIADAFKMSMQAQQSSVQQMIGGLAQAARPQITGPGWLPHPSPFAAAPQPMVPPAMPVTETWHFSLNGQQSSGLHLAQVQQYIQTGQIVASTMVWKTGMAQWMPASQVPELAPYLTASQGFPPPMTSESPGPPPA